jgi:hypothetical protein
MNKMLLDLYSDYLNCTFGKPTATGLSYALDNAVRHDKITRFLSSESFSNKDLWQLVKPAIRGHENKGGAIIFDDTIIPKPYSEENDLISWHYDHTQNKNVKGVNMLNCIYHYDHKTIPLGFVLIKKTECYLDKKTGKERRKSKTTKNEYVIEQLKIIMANKIKHEYILMDTWFSCCDTLKFIHLSMKKTFVCAIKSNRLIALNDSDKHQGIYTKIDAIHWQDNTPIIAWLKGLEFPVLLHRQVFTNKDGSVGYLYLACNNIGCSVEIMERTYQKRWKVEEFHKTLKSNTNIAKSFAHTIITQSNHIFSSVYAAFKLECINFKLKSNHFAIKAKLCCAANKAALQTLNDLYTHVSAA